MQPSEGTDTISPLVCKVSSSKAVFDLDPSTVYRWERDGKIQLYRVNGCTFIVIEEMVELIRGGKSAPARKSPNPQAATLDVEP